jgi:hypothetical protein
MQLEYLEFNAGKDPLDDRYRTGILAGINEVLNIRADDITQEDKPNDD